MKKYILPAILIAIFIIGYFLKEKKQYFFEFNGYIQGTTYTVKYYSKNNIGYSDSIKRILDRFDMSLSSYKSNSIISRVNRNEPDIHVDQLFEYVFNLSKEVNDLTNGAFDITVAPLVNHWGFGWEEKSMPDQSDIDSIMEFIGMDKIKLINHRVVKKDERVQLDVNAIAQGYSVDILAKFLENRGIINYMIDIGGEVKANGVKPEDKFWKIGIERPGENSKITERNLNAIVLLKNSSLATSGNYRKYYEKDGMKYVHTINPKTGKTIKSNLLSASVLSIECGRADAFATSFMVLGLEKSKELVENIKDIEAYFIYADTTGNIREWMTPGFKKIVAEQENQ